MSNVIMIATNGDATAWLNAVDGQVYIAHTKATAILPSGIPANVRWECSEGHWYRYFGTVHAAAGWRATCSFCGADGARMGHDPAREADGSYDPCVGEPICERCRDSLELDADDCCDGCDSDSSEEAIR